MKFFVPIVGGDMDPKTHRNDKEAHSNIVRIRFVEPTGGDATVLEKLQRWKLSDREYLQLYRNHPQTRYRSSIRHRLLYQHARVTGKEADSFPYRSVETTLGFKPVSELVSDDRRLEKAVTTIYDAMRKTRTRLTIQQALDLMSAETGVPLGASPELVHLRLPISGLHTLVECMNTLEEQTQAVWLQRGDGYFLTRDE